MARANGNIPIGEIIAVVTAGLMALAAMARAQDVGVFVSDGTTNGDIGGLAGADAMCQAEGEVRFPAFAGPWRAWISDSSTDARDRIPLPAGGGAYVLAADGTTVIAMDLVALTNASSVHLLNEIHLPQLLTWTGTGTDGAKVGSARGSTPLEFCDDWTSSKPVDVPITGLPQAWIGNTDQVNFRWTANGLGQCNNVAHLYCFSSPKDVPRVRLLEVHEDAPESATDWEQYVEPKGTVRAVMLLVEFSDVQPAKPWMRDPRRVASHMLGEWAVVRNSSARSGGQQAGVSLTDCKGLCVADASCVGVSYSDWRQCTLMTNSQANLPVAHDDRWDSYLVASRVDLDSIDRDLQPPLARETERDAQNIYALQSLGTMSFEVDVVPGWKSLGKASDFSQQDPSTKEWTPDWTTYIQQAIQLWDPDVDYSLYDVVLIVAEQTKSITPSPTHFDSVDTDDGGHIVRYQVTLGDDSYENAFVNLVHEMGHVFGLPDLYPYSPLTKHFVGVWDIMGDMQYARNFLGWHRYKNGWLTEDEIQSVDAEGDHPFTLKAWPQEPSEVASWESQPGTAMLVSTSCTPRTWPPSLLYVIEAAPPYLEKHTGQREGGGVVAYTVDARRWSGNDPIEVSPFEGSDAEPPPPLIGNAAIQPGKSRVLEGGCLTLHVEARTASGGFEVRLERSPDRIHYAVTLRAGCSEDSKPLEVFYRPGCNPLIPAAGEDASWIGVWPDGATPVEIFHTRDCTGESHVIPGESANLCDTDPSPSGRLWNDAVGSVLIGERGKQVVVRRECDGESEQLEILNSAGCNRLSSTLASWLDITPGTTVTLYRTLDCQGDAQVVTGPEENLCETPRTNLQLANNEPLWNSQVRSIWIE